MNRVRAIYHLMRSDFLERLRRYSFLIVVGATAYAGYLMVPSTDASYNAFVIAGHRGFYNSPWVGTVFGVVASTLLTLLGFYLVKDAVNRDYVTRVGQIIATTPIAKPTYILGKWLSNLLVLTVILAVLTGMALTMQLVRAEEGDLDLGALVAPIWLMGFPILAIVAAMAVLFECIPLLRGGAGNVVYFFIWGVVLASSVGRMFVSVRDITPHNDLTGLSRTMVDIRQQMITAGLDISRGATDLGVPTRGRVVGRFLWDGMDWSADIVVERLAWVGVAVALALSAAILFDRFDPGRWRFAPLRRKQGPKPDPGTSQEQIASLGLPQPSGKEAGERTVHGTVLRLTPLPDHGTPAGFVPVLLAELRLVARDRKWWWLVVALGLIIASLLSPLDVVRRHLLPAAWLWPILCWSALGSREARYHTGQVVFSTPHLFRRQLLAGWGAGFVLAILTGSGAGVRLVLAGQWDHVVAWAVGAAFVPSLALALGVWSGGTRLFEVLYVLWWYVGSIDRVPILDYMGIAAQSAAGATPVIYFVASVLLFCVAVAGRRRQLQA